MISSHSAFVSAQVVWQSPDPCGPRTQNPLAVGAEDVVEVVVDVVDVVDVVVVVDIGVVVVVVEVVEVSVQRSDGIEAGIQSNVAASQTALVS